MKSIYIFISAVLFLAPSLWGQPPGMDGKKGEKIKAFRIAYITQKLGLTPDESKAFWPVYDEFRDKQKKLRDSQRDFMEKDINLLSDKELEEMLDKRLSLREEEVKLEREYLQKLKGVISVRKLAQLHHTERQFREELLKVMQNRKGGSGKDNMPPHGMPPPPHGQGHPPHGGGF